MIFAHSKSIVNKAKKEAAKWAAHREQVLGEDYKSAYEAIYQQRLGAAYKEFEEYLEVSKNLHNIYTDFIGDCNNKAYFITIRPDDKKVTFIEFKEKIDKLVARPCFIDSTISYEQKGECLEDIGIGFHVHIVAKMKQRSKGEVLRNIVSSFSKWISENKISSNCIQVDITSNPEKLIQNYLIEYQSDDGHKIKTKNTDALWRANMGLV